MKILYFFYFLRSSENYEFAEIKEREDSHNLPKIIHFIWTGEPIRDQYIDNIQSFVMNTDYQVLITHFAAQWNFFATANVFRFIFGLTKTLKML